MRKRSLALFVLVLAGCGAQKSPDVGHVLAAKVQHCTDGQLLPLGWLSRLFEPHVAGLARFGSTWLYVSEGTGFWGPPLRVGTSCEVAAITLESA